MNWGEMMTKEDALAIWLDEIGNQEYSYDFSGRKIKREDYMVDNQVGWVVTYIKPIELGGMANKGNIIIMNYLTKEQKGMNYPEFIIDYKHYIAQYDKKGDFHYIEEILEEEDI